MNKKAAVAVVAVLGLAAGIGCAVWQDAAPAGRIYGSVDTRTVRLAFEEAGRLAELTVEEGQTVKAGDVVGKLDDERYRIALQTARATESVAQKNLDLALSGARQEDIAAARARVKALSAAALLSERNCTREKKLGHATSAQRVDQFCSQATVDTAQKAAAQKELERLLAGTRAEEIAVYRAQLAAASAQVEEARRALSHCVLKAPSDAVIRARLKEPGDMVSSAAPVVEMALMNPLWVRAWVDEVNLDKVKPGMTVTVASDSYPDRTFKGTVGFVSTVAEFTPKSVQTEAVRTSLVYEVRVTVTEAADFLRLGMPVTVNLTAE